MKSQLLLIALAAFAVNANAKNHAKHAAEVYKIDAAASKIEWTGSKATGSSHNGTVAVKEGQIEMAKGELKGGNFSVKMDTITDLDLAGSPDYKAKLEGHLKNEDFFNVTKFPESTFKIKSVTKKSATEVTVKGDFTMIGKTQEIEFPATIKVDGNTVTGTADIKLDRTKWDLKYGSGKFFKNLGDKLINDEFNLKLNLVAKK